MSVEITVAFVKQFERNLDFLVQQKGSRFRPCVRVESGVVGKKAYYDQIGATEAQLKAGRHSDTPLISTPHARRQVTMYDYEVADLIDDADKIKTLIDPQNGYAMSMKWALQRAMDDRMITEALGTAYTGEEGATAVSMLPANVIAVGAAGLTISKLRSAKEILDASELDPEEPRFIAVSAKQVTDMLETTEATSSDYNTVKALVQGDVDTFMGFKFVRTQRLAVDASDYRRCIAWAQNGLMLAIGADVKGRIDERADKSYSTQVFASMSIGATRMEEEKVVEILCSEA
jgi:hypothetical protein